MKKRLTQEKQLLIKLRNQKIESIIYYEAVLIIFIIISLMTQFSTYWVIMGLTILFSYGIAYFFLKDSQRLVIPPLTIIFMIFFVFRIDQVIMETPFVTILTRFTTHSLVLLLKYGNLLPLLLLIGSYCFFQSIGRSKSENLKRNISFLTFCGLMAGFIVFNGFSQDKITTINATTFQLENLIRISIVESCSGIYGLIIFLSSFFFFVNVTRINRVFKSSQVIVYGILGLIGVYLANLLRMLILINLSLSFSSALWFEAHLYLGSIFILCYLSFFWLMIWSSLPIRSS